MGHFIVTGCAGYIGRCLIRRLAILFKKPIIGIDNLRYGQPAPNLPFGDFQFREMDVVDYFHAATEAELRGAEAIFHLAAIVGAPACDADPVEAERVNVISTHAMLSALAARNITSPMLIYPNTNSMYGSLAGVCTEETEGKPLSLYARTKIRAEDGIRECYPNHCIFRLATAFGLSPRMRRDLLVNDFVWRARHEGRIEVYDPGAMRNYIFVDDICEAFAFAVLNWERCRGQIFNLGHDGLNMTKLELANTVASLHERCEVIVCEGSDPDKRDCRVSSAKLRSVGFNARIEVAGFRNILADIDGYYAVALAASWMTNLHPVRRKS